ncbi:hypothetical protein [Pseudokineococcus basanitobsidens]
MRGGVTSGVVYPWAVCELARQHRLVSVGGTSAGAIAAGVAAAAEHARDGGRTGRGGFGVLAELPGRLAAVRGGRSRLETLFSPEPGTAPLLRLLLAVLAAREAGPGRSARALAWLRALGTGAAAAACAPGGWWRVLLGVVPGVLVLVALLLVVPVPDPGGRSDGAAPVVGEVVLAVLGVLLVVAGGLVGAALVHLRALRVAVPGNLYGVCSGMPARTSSGDEDELVLTPWLTDLLDETAGLPPGEGPLLLGHLWAGPGRPAPRGLAEPPADAAVDLRVVTTSVTHGRPVHLPRPGAGSRASGDGADDGLPALYLDPVELRRLLPERVVAHLEAHPPPLPVDPVERLVRRARDAAARPLVPLPAASDLPVVLVVRMSLSYPLLVSAVPLHALDEADLGPLREAARGVLAERRRDQPGPDEPGLAEQDADGRGAVEVEAVLARLARRPRTRRVWFTDGGISSNFPIHLFDRAAPRRPTFGVTLRSRRAGDGPVPDPLDPGRPGRADDALAPVVHPLDPRDGGPASTWAFARAVLATMQDWTDTAALPLPGFRDRIAQVDVDPRDGGLDLRMPPEAIARLAESGRLAGAALAERFTTRGPDGWTGWERHRWTRLRANLPLLEGAAGEVVAALDPGTAAEGERDLRDLLRLPVDEAPLLPWTGRAQRRRAQHAVGGLLEASPVGVAADERLDAGAPQPPLDLRYSPRGGG